MKFKSFLVLMFVFVLALSACAPTPVEPTMAPTMEETAAPTEAMTEEPTPLSLRTLSRATQTDFQ